MESTTPVREGAGVPENEGGPDLAQRENEQLLHEAAAIAQMGSWRRDVATGVMEWSDELYRLAGYEPGEVEPTLEWLVERIHPDDRAGFLRRSVTRVKEGRAFEHEFRFVKADGDVCWVHSKVRPVCDEHGEVVEVRGVAQDVTDRRRTSELHRVVSEMVSDIVFSYNVVDGRMTLDWVTDAFTRVLGHPLEPDSGGELFRPITHPEDVHLVEHAEEVVLSGQPHVFEIRVLTQDGAIRWLRLYAQPVRDDPAGPVVRVYGAAQDITDRKEAENTLRRAYERERDAAARLREADRMKDEFLSTASHELRTPLAAIAGFASALTREGDLAPDLRRQLGQKLERNALELGDMVERLLDFSRVEAGAVHVGAEPVPVEETIGRCLEHDAATLAGHHVEVDVPAQLAVFSDSQALTHVLRNLLANAGKYSPPGSRITITTRERAGWARISVSDEGPGLAPEVAARVFERFYRGPDQPAGTHGTGIGLSIARSYVELMGGHIEVQSEPGHGATFVFTLPLAGSDAVSHSRTSAAHR